MVEVIQLSPPAGSLRLVGRTVTTTRKRGDVIQLGTPAPKPKKKSKKREKVEKFLIAETALFVGVVSALGAGLVNPALIVPAFLGSTIGTASLLGAIREKPSLAKTVLTGGTGAGLVRLPETIREKVGGLTGKQKAAAAAAAGAVGGAAAVVAGQKIIERFRETRIIERVPDIGLPAQVPVQQFAQIPAGVEPVPTQPIAAKFEEPVIEEKPAEAMVMPQITNKINVSPEINISFRKSKKFINQQINV